MISRSKTFLLQLKLSFIRIYYEVSEVVSRVEWQPLDVLHQNESGDQHQLSESDGIDSLLWNDWNYEKFRIIILIWFKYGGTVIEHY